MRSPMLFPAAFAPGPNRSACFQELKTIWSQQRRISRNSASLYAGEKIWFSTFLPRALRGLAISSAQSLASYRPLAVAPQRYSPIRGYRAYMEKAFWASRILAPVRSMTPFSIFRFSSIRASSTT